MGPDIAAIEAWTQIFHNKAQLVATVSKHYLLHKKAVRTEIADLEANWDLGYYFWAGVKAADLADLLIGPIDSPEAEMFL